MGPTKFHYKTHPPSSKIPLHSLSTAIVLVMTSYSGETPPPRLHICGSAIPPESEHLPCPRCNSFNTKFCYYNNYNLSQPRHFCKACRRYWTRGGTLRDVPVGGGSRKNQPNKRPRIATSSGDTVVSVPVDKNETTSVCVDVNLNETGHAVESSFHSSGFGFGLGSSFSELCFGLEHGGGEGRSGSCDTWQGGESFGWPDLAISSLGWGPKES